MKTAVVLGVGAERGLGAQLCVRFASLGMRVIAAGRTAAKIGAVADMINKAGGNAKAVTADATSQSDISTLFDEAGETLDLAIFNVGNNTPGDIADITPEYFESGWRIGCFGGFLFGKEAATRMTHRGAGTILFTGASASLRGKANFGAFSSSKGALRNFAQALAKEVGPLGVHVGHVIVDGAIDGEVVKTRYPEYADKLGEMGVSIEGIVDGYQFIHEQPNRAWTFELDVRTSIEQW
ncbi:MAG: SDR family NAD(P)-dependent oxidoreductase [Pseudomonadota bacterium]